MIGKHKAITATIGILCIAVCILTFLIMPSEYGQLNVLKVTLLKVGKADAIVVQSGDKTMIIDTGEEDDGEELTVFLKNQGVSYVDALIITHFDNDHVGGADTLVESVDIGQVFLPAYLGSSAEYLDFMNALQHKGISPQCLTQPAEFWLGDASVLVEPPLSYEATDGSEETDNNFSLITTVIHGENRFLFAGDAEKRRLREWLSGGSAEECDFLKIPHHGVYNTALRGLLDETSPKYAVICSSDKNPAQVQTLELLEQYNIHVFQTKDGNVTATSDGKHLEVHQKLK